VKSNWALQEIARREVEVDLGVESREQQADCAGRT
jgi:hypothetical protein